MSAEIEAQLTSLPWVSKADLLEVREEVTRVREELGRVERELREVEGRLGRLAGQDIASVRREVEGIGKRVEELRSRVAGVEGRVKELAARVSRMEAVAGLTTMVGRWKAGTCGKCVKGVCGAWRVSDEVAATLRRMFGGDAVVKDGGVWRVRVFKVPHLCAPCPLYEPRARREDEGAGVGNAP